MNDLSVNSGLSRQEIVEMLAVNDKTEYDLLIARAYSIKEKNVGKIAYLRGLIEFSNICVKDCLYCGIRKGNDKILRYSMTDDEILKAVYFAYKNRINGIVLQSGEKKSYSFTKRICDLILRIKDKTNPEFRITLSLGEQTAETYNEWFAAGAQRYLLRIETTNEDLFRKIHPEDNLHSYKTRRECLENIQKTGFQTGTGVMIGLPFQRMEDLADDLLFMKSNEIDMVGMGPYLEHADTPLYSYRDSLIPLSKRMRLSLSMIAVLRILMPEINIASTTALQSIDPMGRELGLLAGANILMPNITPVIYKKSYQLYNNKPCIDEDSDKCLKCLISRVQKNGETISFDDYGDSKHYKYKTIYS